MSSAAEVCRQMPGLVIEGYVMTILATGEDLPEVTRLPCLCFPLRRWAQPAPTPV
jgi:hypothetical protein